MQSSAPSHGKPSRLLNACYNPPKRICISSFSCCKTPWNNFCQQYCNYSLSGHSFLTLKSAVVNWLLPLLSDYVPVSPQIYRTVHLDFFALVGWGRGLRTALCDVSLNFSRILQDLIPDCLVKYALEVSLGKCWALQVLMRSDLFCDNQSLIIRYGFHSLLSQAFDSSGIVSKIKLGTNKDNWNRWSMVIDLWKPL